MINILGTIKSLGTSALHLVEEPFEEAGKLEALISTAVADEPGLKTALMGLVPLVETVGSDSVADVGADGLNVTSDIKTLTDVLNVYTYLKTTVVPAVKKVYGDVKADLGSSTPAPSGPAPVPPLPPMIPTPQAAAAPIPVHAVATAAPAAPVVHEPAPVEPKPTPAPAPVLVAPIKGPGLHLTVPK